MRLNNELCPELFCGEKLFPDVLLLLSDIAELRADIVGKAFEKVYIRDVVLCGSCAGYSYYNKAGIDVGIIWQAKCLSADEFDKKLFFLNSGINDFPFNFKIGNRPIVVHNMALMPAGAGIYSLWQNKWLKFPQKDNYQFTDYELYLKYCQLDGQVNDFMSSLPKNSELFLLPEDCAKAENLYFSLARNAFYNMAERGEYNIDSTAYRCWKYLGRATQLLTYLGNCYGAYVNSGG